MATYNVSDSTAARNVNWREVVNNPRSPRYNYGIDKSRAMRTVDVAWEDADLFARAVLGYPIGVGYHGHDAYIRRRIPWASTAINVASQKPFLYASEVELEGLGVPADKVQNNEYTDEDHEAWYEKARETVHFETRSYEVLSDQALLSQYQGDEASLKRYVTRVIRPAGEALTLDTGAWWYFKGAPPAQVVKSRGMNKLLISWNLSYCWHQIPLDCVPSYYFNQNATNKAIDKCLGRVNKTVFAGYPIGTLLLMAVEIRPLISPFGDRMFDITYMFKFFHPTTTGDVCGNDVGHNHVFWPGSQTVAAGWYEIGTGDRVAKPLSIQPAPACTNFVAFADNMSIYDFADFANLFRPAQYQPA